MQRNADCCPRREVEGIFSIQLGYGLRVQRDIANSPTSSCLRLTHAVSLDGYVPTSRLVTVGNDHRSGSLRLVTHSLSTRNISYSMIHGRGSGISHAHVPSSFSSLTAVTLISGDSVSNKLGHTQNLLFSSDNACIGLIMATKCSSPASSQLTVCKSGKLAST